ncbi:MAG: FHA domain-containing protein [Anaerolineales bacterium]
MIVCPHCKEVNMTGAIFCAECGAQMKDKDSQITQRNIMNNSSDDQYLPFGGSNAWGSLHLLDTGQVLPLAVRNEFTIGRVSEGQPIMPDIDLSTSQAFAAGVSRLHAVIRREGARIIIMDLGSANGTYVNGKRISPNVEQTIHHGDIVALGKMKIQILVNNNQGK